MPPNEPLKLQPSEPDDDDEYKLACGYNVNLGHRMGESAPSTSSQETSDLHNEGKPAWVYACGLGALAVVAIICMLGSAGVLFKWLGVGMVVIAMLMFLYGVLPIFAIAPVRFLAIIFGVISGTFLWLNISQRDNQQFAEKFEGKLNVIKWAIVLGFFGVVTLCSGICSDNMKQQQDNVPGVQVENK